jgi:hypothetical protein
MRSSSFPAPYQSTTALSGSDISHHLVQGDDELTEANNAA